MDLALALLSGVLLVLSFPKFGTPACAWIALAPLLVAVSHRPQSARRAFGLGLASGAIYFWGTLYWLVQTMVTFGGLSKPLAVLAALLLVAYLALFPAFFAVFQARLARTFGTAAVLLAPFVWVATEMGRTYIWDGFPWELLGYSQATVLPVAQIASVVGVYGLSALVVSVSAAAAYSAIERHDRRRWTPAIAAGVLILGIGLWGGLRLRSHVLTSAGTPIRVAVLQGNIPQDEKWDPSMADAILARYIEMSREAVGRGATFILWPESATPFDYEEEPQKGAPIRRLAREAHVTFLIGSDQIERVEQTSPGTRPLLKYYNAAFLIDPSGRTAAVYRKIHLVPFGEYVPAKSLLFFAGKIVDAVSDYSPGTKFEQLPVNGHDVATAICYEVIYSSLMRQFVQGGSELLTTITNDAWYGRTSAPYQHWQQASLRAIEEGRYLARAANTGISGFVDPYGHVMQSSNMFQSAVLADDLRFITTRTIYSWIGDIVGWLSVAAAALALLATRRARL